MSFNIGIPQTGGEQYRRRHSVLYQTNNFYSGVNP